MLRTAATKYELEMKSLQQQGHSSENPFIHFAGTLLSVPSMLQSSPREQDQDGPCCSEQL